MSTSTGIRIIDLTQNPTSLFRIDELKIENCRLRGIRREARFLFTNIAKLALVYHEMDTINADVDLGETIEHFATLNTAQSNRPIEDISLTLIYDKREERDDYFTRLKAYPIRSLRIESRSDESAGLCTRIKPFSCDPGSLEHLQELHLMLDEPVDARIFSKLTNLRLLDLSCNKITVLESDFVSENLEKLDLFSNEISQIRVDSNRKSTLKSLNLNLNLMESISAKDFASFGHLSELFLSENRIAHVCPLSFSNMSCLVRLDLNGNRLTCLNSGEFVGLNSLEELDLSDNEIDTEPGSCPFSCLTRLTKLNLAGNDLKQVDGRLFGGLASSLADLDLSRNMISIVEENSFAGLTSLVRLNLSFNRIEVFTAAHLTGLTKLKTLNLSRTNLKNFNFVQEKKNAV